MLVTLRLLWSKPVCRLATCFKLDSDEPALVRVTLTLGRIPAMAAERFGINLSTASEAKHTLTALLLRMACFCIKAESHSQLASTIFSASSTGRVNITSWLPSISSTLHALRRDDIFG